MINQWTKTIAAWLAMQSLSLASLNIVATVPNLGMLAREIGGDAVQVRVLVGPDRDAHFLEARPSMMTAIRRADLLFAVGAELEIGWLPAAIRGANNRRVQPGQPGYLEAAVHTSLIGIGKPADRALGDVHPMGNPHFYMDPERMAEVGYALADRLSMLAPDHADAFSERAKAFATAVESRMTDWRSRVARDRSVLLYHEDADYLLNALEVRLLGYIEPLPGIPPSATHLRELVRGLADQEAIVWSMSYQPANASEFISRELGWPAYRLPCQVGMDASAEDYFTMIDEWVKTLEQ